MPHSSSELPSRAISPAMTARNSVRRRASSSRQGIRTTAATTSDSQAESARQPAAGGEDEPQQVVTPQPRGFDRNAPLAHDLLLQAARRLRIAPGDIGVREQPRDVGVVESAIRTLRPAAGLQLHEALDEGVGQTGTQRIAHRDVDRPDLGRHGAEQRQQQVLVRQHHGGLLAQPAAGRQPAEDRRHVLALHGVRHGGHRGRSPWAATCRRARVRHGAGSARRFRARTFRPPAPDRPYNRSRSPSRNRFPRQRRESGTGSFSHSERALNPATTKRRGVAKANSPLRRRSAAARCTMPP